MVAIKRMRRIFARGSSLQMFLFNGDSKSATEREDECVIYEWDRD